MLTCGVQHWQVTGHSLESILGTLCNLLQVHIILNIYNPQDVYPIPCVIIVKVLCDG